MIQLKVLYIVIQYFLNNKVNNYFITRVNFQIVKYLKILIKSCGADRDRTCDLFRARELLSQLSYSPKFLVGLRGLEPRTSSLSEMRSNQLSYKPHKSSKIKNLYRTFELNLFDHI